MTLHKPIHKPIVATLSLLYLFSLTAHASNNTAIDSDLMLENNEESYYLLKDTDGTFDLIASDCFDVAEESHPQIEIEEIANCDLMAFIPDAFIPDNKLLLDENFSEVVRSSAAVLPVTGVALLSTTAGSWGKYLNGVSKRAFTKWALSLAGGVVVVGYVAEKFAASEGVFLSSSTAGNNEGESLVTSGGEEQLSPASPDPKPIPPPVVSTDSHTEEGTKKASTEETTSLWESMDDVAFEALLNERNIDLGEYYRLRSAVGKYGIKYLRVPMLPPGKENIFESRSDYFRDFFRSKGIYLSKDQLKEEYENQYIFDASYLLLVDVFKLIKNRTLRPFQGLNLVKDGYALYTRPLMVNVATQMPRILKETCASRGLSHLDFSDCLEIYSHALLEAVDPMSNDSVVEPGKYLDSKYTLKAFTTGKIFDPVSMKAIMYSVMASKVEELKKVYVADVKRLMSMVIAYHNDLMWDFFKISSENQISRISRTKILEKLATRPSWFLNRLRDRQDFLFTQKIYADPLFYRKSDCLKNNQVAIFGC